MIGKLIFFFISLIVASITSYLLSILKASGIQDRKMKSFRSLCFFLPFWIILSAASAIAEKEFFASVYTAKVAFVIAVPYVSFWFLLNFIDFKYITSRLLKFILFFIPAVDILILLTNPWHKLYFLSYENPPLPKGFLFWVHLAFTVGGILIVYPLFIRYIIKNFRKRPVLLLTGIGAFVPIILNVSFVFGLFGIHDDIASLGYFFTIIIFAYSSYAPRLRKASQGLLSNTLAKIAKSPEISEGTVEEAARLISREACIALDTYRVRVWKYDGEKQTLKCIACYNNSIGEYTVQEDFNMQSIAGFSEHLASERIIAISDAKESFALTGLASPYDPEVCAVLLAPVNIDLKPTGIVCVEQNRNLAFPERREWNQEEQSFVSSLADLMAIVITNEERQILKDAESASRAKSQFITNISHEIRTPMNAIMGMIELALRENDINVKNEHLKTVKQAETHLMSIINDILDFSKIESGKREVIQEEYFTASLLDEIIDTTSMNVIGSDIRFAVKADNNIPRMLYGDEAKIRQSIINILDNAVKYTEKGSVSLGVHGEIINNDTMNLIFVVTDTGIGIKPEDIDIMFNDFTQLDYENKKSIEGIGLGLSITKNFINAMGGNISVQSEYGQGSTFTVSLPQKYHSNEPLATVKKPENKSVLIFERREVYAESLAFTVKNLGADCVIVSSGTELYEKMESAKADSSAKAGGKFDYLFISYGLYKKNEDTILKFRAPNTETIILTEFDEVIQEKNLKMFTMPVYCTIIAEVLNGIYENVSISAGYESAVKFSAPDAKILIVDDISTNLKVAQGLLMPYKMQIDLCSSGKDAIETVQSAATSGSHYDLVFMDHRMPGMDGVDTTRYIRKWEKEQKTRAVPIIALTANAILGMKEMFIRNGFNDFIPKPIDTVLLNEILEKWIPKEKQVRT